ncbi:branched-chain amino acid ABC transporter permease [Thermobifida halotolerans]|uniref:Branched-chain amino acid ABC transporter permease n=1 Tax=Thermobifida halotolerans TaxID=483545 RepID=A0A399G6J5_9ACTN|nr:branched-chain amino acid ABC transporter permease [Thermobifida halotolerans]UOE20887.1 branched-chain amino acid ABC transporter permease [Thermobifida halotolerans]
MAEILIDAVTLGALYLLFALGMSVAWGTIGILNFAHGSTFMFSAMVAHYAVQSVALPMWAMVLLGAAVGMVLSVLTQALIFNLILRRNPDLLKAEMQIVVGGIGAASVLLAIAQNLTKSVPFGFSASTFQIATYQLGPVQISNVQIVILVAAFGLAGLAAWWLRSARAGLALRAIGVNPEVASLMGVDRGRMALGTMAAAGALAGVAGILLTYYLGSIAPETGDSFLISAFAAIILGGIGSVAGVVTGAMVLALAETLVVTQMSGTWASAVAFGLIFVVLLFLPRGIFGRKEVRRT